MRLIWLYVRYYWQRIAGAPEGAAYPYDPRRPEPDLYQGPDTPMGTPDQALAWYKRQRDNGSTAWHNLCEKGARTSYNLQAMYSSAELHSKAIPSDQRHGNSKPPSKGDLVMYENGGYGHIVVATGNGWDVWTNDYTGRGKMGIAGARKLAPWCGARKWYVADAWWSTRHSQDTHNPEAAPPAPPVFEEDDDMPFIFKTHQDSKDTGQGIGNGAHYLVSGGTAVQCDGGYALAGTWQIISSPSERMDEAFYKSVKRIKL